MRILIGLLVTAPLWSQAAAEANKSYQSADGRQRMVATLTGEHRDARQKPKELIEALGIKNAWRWLISARGRVTWCRICAWP